MLYVRHLQRYHWQLTSSTYCEGSDDSRFEITGLSESARLSRLEFRKLPLAFPLAFFLLPSASCNLIRTLIGDTMWFEI